MRHIQKLAINEKSIIFPQSSWNLVKIITSWVDYFHHVSWRLGKKCGFFINGQLLNMSRFFSLRLYVVHQTSALPNSIRSRSQNFNEKLEPDSFWGIKTIKSLPKMYFPIFCFLRLYKLYQKSNYNWGFKVHLMIQGF